MAVTEHWLTAQLTSKRVRILNFAGHRWLMDGSGTLYQPERDCLLVADLHLEKGSYLKGWAHPIPAGDSRATLERLSVLLDMYQPAVVVCLGDSFHDAGGALRMSCEDRRLLAGLVDRVEEWLWVVGNHDPHLPAGMPGRSVENWCFGEVVCQHIPTPGVHHQIVGHYHPKCRIVRGRQRYQGRCFVVTGELLILPAFGQYTGGLSINDEALLALAGAASRQCWMLYEGALYGPVSE